MTLSAKQHEARLVGIGGSEAAAALGLSKWKTALQLYHEKRGELEAFDPGMREETEEMWWGRMLEPIVRQKFAERTGRIVRLPRETLKHSVHDFMVAHVDGVSERQDGTDPRGYEGKTALFSIGWGDEGTDQIPTDYLMQNHHYIVVTGLPVFDVATLIGRRFAMYEVREDKEMGEMLIEGERDFMRRVHAGEPPPLDYQHRTAIDVVKKLYPGTNGRRVYASDDCITWRATLEQQIEIEKAAQLEIKALRARLLEHMGENALLGFPDGQAFRRQLTKRAGYSVAPTEYVDARFVKDPQGFFTRTPKK